MKTNFKFILAFAALSISTAAFAHTDNLNFSDSAYPVLPKAESTKTRAQVKQELIEAKENGALDIPDSQYPGPMEVSTNKTRAQVQQELQQSKMNGEKSQMDKLYRG
ncbi:DUF4148 domain-containing protein [Oxalicibacterium faecigallinarum]|uniref:DUF4148 domain-containing protein n=1 Tax=Oxalicibacterium faecigallinarum TaxID=573741 RepID=A0A8J3F116_9BURK|nr:DUF4148 domain-containing protein [Oxalicibacterium faecigallinarum]GGI16927.1 hypothetical protein GCM10008066_06410 [Oxalicibacterium faecigallinarum]